MLYTVFGHTAERNILLLMQLCKGGRLQYTYILRNDGVVFTIIFE